MEIYATKGNVEYTIDESDINHYQSLGFQISKKQDTLKKDDAVKEPPTKRQYTKKSVTKTPEMPLEAE